MHHSHEPHHQLPRPHSAGFDPELLYVQCAHCGRPVLWTQGKLTRIIRDAGVSRQQLDATHVMLTEGCPECNPEQSEFRIQLIRLERMPPHNPLSNDDRAGNA